jgi:AcrR family transcriptional regulator
MKRASPRDDTKMRMIGRAAAKLFNQKGYLETSLVDISSAVGMSKGGIFHYFPTKNDILYFILSNYMDVVLEGLEEDLQEFDESLSKIRFIISRHLELYTKNVHEAKTLLHEASLLPPKYLNSVHKKEKKYFQIVSAVLSDFLGDRAQKDELTAITFSLFGICNWIYSWYNPKGNLSHHELSEIIYSIFSGGLMKYKQEDVLSSLG